MAPMFRQPAVIPKIVASAILPFVVSIHLSIVASLG
jgi:hypothetical protein